MATFTVTTLNDELDSGATVEELSSGAGLSLREAVELANASAGADRIEFAGDLGGLIRLDADPDPVARYDGQLFIEGETTIDGGGRITITGDVLDNDITAPGTDITTLADNGVAQLADNVRAFFVRPDADTTLIGLTLTGGRARNDNGHGGAIYSQSDLTLIDSRITGNSTTGDNAKGGGIFSRTNITLIDSEVRDNSTSGERSDGGGVAAEGTLTITRSDISENVTVGRFSDGGGAYAGGAVVVSASNISGNAVSEFGANGGGLATKGALTLTNSTVAFNEVSGYRGYGGGIRVEGDATISHSTIVGNSVAEVPAFSDRNAGPSVVFEADLTVNNSIIVGNVGPRADELEVGAYTPYQDYNLTFTGLNIVGANADRFDASALDTVINADPSDVFESSDYRVASNGASVPTIALSADPGNPALDAAAGDNILEVDARGVPAGGARDLGAYELITNASLIVTTGDDVVDATDGQVSLREAIYFATQGEGPNSNTITFAADVEDTIRLTEGALLIFSDLTIDGGGRITITGDANGDDVVDANGVTDVTASSAAGLLDDNSQIFYAVGRSTDITVDGLTLTGGRSEAESAGGGAIKANGAAIILNSTISGNSTTGEEAGGGGVYARDTLTITDSTISRNVTTGDDAEGGGVFSRGPATITRSAITENQTLGAEGYGAGIFADDSLTLAYSTLAYNMASGPKGYGAGLYSNNGDVLITHSTIVGNMVEQPTADANFVAGPGVYVDGSITINNSIIVGNTAASGGPEISRSGADGVTFTGFNIVGSDAGAYDASGLTNVINADPSTLFAGVLANNGGAVQTIALKADTANPALDAAASTDTDARDLPRVDLNFIDNGGNADLGAFELQNQFLFAPTITSAAAFTVVEGRTAVATITATDDQDGVRFAITGGADAARFVINAVTGGLSFEAAPDFDAPTDAGADNIYNIEITATDSDGLSASQTLAVTVSANPPPPTAPIGPSLGADTLFGTAQNDTINALAGDDTVNGRAGDDLLIGASGDDSIKGAAGDDRLRGGGGEDTLKGGGGADNIKGGGGGDVIRGNGGADVIRSGGGADDVNGGGGADLIFGGGGADQLNGGGGADTLRGNGGNDTLKGNGGADVFQFRTSDRNDTISDFRQGQDKIEILNGANRFEALSIEQDGRDVLIGFGAGQVRVLTDNVSAFDEGDFIF